MSVHPNAQTIYQQLEAESQAAWPQIQKKRAWEYQVMGWCLNDDRLRTQALRFIDCLPALRTSRQVVRHFQEYFPRSTDRLPLALRAGQLAAAPTLLTAGAVATATRWTVSRMARLFIAGESLEDAAPTLTELADQGFLLNIDLLGEATISQKEADQYEQAYHHLIEQWSGHVTQPPYVSLKLSSFAFPFSELDPEGAWQQVKSRMVPLLEVAQAHDGFVNVDMEQYDYRALTWHLFQRLLEEHFPDCEDIGIVLQSYLKDAEPFAQQMLDWVKQRGKSLTIRLVRGAYWDAEQIWAQQRGWPCPVYTEKDQTDACFERLTEMLFQQTDHVRVAIATHNMASMAFAIAKAKEMKIPSDRWELQMLYGTHEALQLAALKCDVPVRLYVPVGELIPGMAYLVRRILENTSQYAFLSMGPETKG